MTQAEYREWLLLRERILACVTRAIGRPSEEAEMLRAARRQFDELRAMEAECGRPGDAAKEAA